MNRFLRRLIIAVYLLSPLLPLSVLLHDLGRPLPLEHLIAISAAIFAFCGFCYQFVSSSRLKKLLRIFGHDSLYRFHRLAPLGLLLLVTVHAGLIEKFLPRENETMNFLGDSAVSLYAGLAVFSLLFLGADLLQRQPIIRRLRSAVTGAFPLRHEQILLVHNLSIVAAAAMLLHVLWLPLACLWRFKMLMASIFGLAISHYFYHKLWRKAYLRRHPYVIQAIEPEADNIWTLHLVPARGKVFSFAAGQYLYLTPQESGIKAEEHPFSISSSPGGQEGLQVTVKASGDFTSTVGSIPAGSRALIDGPYGDFTLEAAAPGRRLVFLAGGIGITPFFSMLAELQKTDPDREVVLIWNVKTKQDLIRIENIEELLSAMPNFSFVAVLSRDTSWEGPKGRISAELLGDILGDSLRDSADYFICGPPSMIASCESILRNLEISARHIHVERFAI